MTKVHYVMPSNRSLNAQSAERGSTLIEVLVAMFILTAGIVVLMVTQLRTLSIVQDAGNELFVAQAARNFVEGMLTNPQVSLSSDDRVVRRYDHYMQKLSESSGSGFCSTVDNSAIARVFSDSNSPATYQWNEIVQEQISAFRYNLCKDLPAAYSVNASISKVGDDGNPSYTVVVEWHSDSGAQQDDSSHRYELLVRDQ